LQCMYLPYNSVPARMHARMHMHTHAHAQEQKQTNDK